MKDLTVVVLTHNRQDLILETVESVLNQTCHDFIFKISDNSDNDETYELLKKKNILSKVIYVRRGKEAKNSLDHFNINLNEITTEYFIFFHDDDVMMPEMIEEIYNKIYNTRYIAVGCNAYILKNNIKTEKKFYKSCKNVIHKTPDSLIIKYCSDCNIVPYPSYIYNKNVLGNIVFTGEAGKYSDVIWLIKLTKKAPVLWIKRPLFYYRIHDGQDSHSVDIVNQNKLYKYYIHTAKFKKTKYYINKQRVKELSNMEFQKINYHRKLNFKFIYVLIHYRCYKLAAIFFIRYISHMLIKRDCYDSI